MPETAPNSKRYQIPFFQNSEIQSKIARDGYALGGRVLSDQDIVDLMKGYQQMMELVEAPRDGNFWPSGRSSDPAVRNAARTAIDAIVPSRLSSLFQPQKANFVGGTFLVKPPSMSSELYPHQDSSHVDEEQFFAVYAWIPLVDVNEENGALYVHPGSHLFGNTQRSLNVPWAFRGHEDTIFKYLQPITMKAGEVLFFDSATIHYSPNNRSEKTRVALNYFIMPEGLPFLHYFTDPSTPEGKVEVYNVDIDFFYNCDFESRPPSTYPYLGLKERCPSHYSKEAFESMCAQHASR